ncbi:hypothetical protein N8I77_003386 [Diaporthe amygdali]|uniref:Uncharacterized protein n=1 Tax=Phomopsis amygdali TaxID=1214568 RepID=A0AAD9SIS9_PHOAM|nr:hypothetical protein N8I77_003386 [Diaporthe amygdali]
MASKLVSRAADTIPVGQQHRRATVNHLKSSLPASLPQADIDYLDNVSDKEQKRIYRKVDWRLTPMLMLLYFFTNLDRSE